MSVTRIAIAAAASLVWGLGCAHAENATAPASCDVPAYLLNGEGVLTQTSAALKERRQLTILVAGTRSSVLPGNDGEAAAYPAQLQAALRERLPGTAIIMSTSLHPKKTAEEAAAEIKSLVVERKPDLLIWQTGTVDAIRASDPDDFRTALEDTVNGLRGSGIDVMLVNLQYSPRTDTVMTVQPYIDGMRVAAQRTDSPLFDRFSIMREWQENGNFDLSGAPPGSALGLELAKRVHYCLGRVMATFVLDAAKIDAAELRIQR